MELQCKLLLAQMAASAFEEVSYFLHLASQTIEFLENGSKVQAINFRVLRTSIGGYPKAVVTTIGEVAYSRTKSGLGSGSVHPTLF